MFKKFLVCLLILTLSGSVLAEAVDPALWFINYPGRQIPDKGIIGQTYYGYYQLTNISSRKQPFGFTNFNPAPEFSNWVNECDGPPGGSYLAPGVSCPVRFAVTCLHGGEFKHTILEAVAGTQLPQPPNALLSYDIECGSSI